MAAPELLQSVIEVSLAVVILATVLTALRLLFRRIERHYRDAVKLYYFVTSLIVIMALAVAAYRYGLVDVLVGSLTALGAMGLVLGLGLVPWLSDVYSGLALMLNPHIKIGTEVEVAGKRGRIVLITLTTTRIAGDDCIIIVPNRKFRDEVVVIYGTKPPERMVEF
ncbi:MAG: mechanosensitive ion channel domain-containing protein [Candidatus Caldarchaeales archaeon]|jgi:small-conductance mechanosensitive channel